VICLSCLDAICAFALLVRTTSFISINMIMFYLLLIQIRSHGNLVKFSTLSWLWSACRLSSENTCYVPVVKTRLVHVYKYDSLEVTPRFS
jgi:hypothetical protein